MTSEEFLSSKATKKVPIKVATSEKAPTAASVPKISPFTFTYLIIRRVPVSSIKNISKISTIIKNNLFLAFINPPS